MTELAHAFRNYLPAFFRNQSRATIVAETSLMVLFIGYLDYVTGYEISLFVFYAVPIFLATWYVDQKWGAFFALVSAVVWWWSDEKAGHPYLMDWIKGWDTIVRVFFFLFVVVGASALKSRYELVKRYQALEQQVIKISEREQQRIGQELHDGLCQYYAAISCAASSLSDDLRRHSASEADSAAEIADLLMKGVVQTRNLARGLFPVQKHESGLESALSELAASTTHLFSIECAFSSPKHVSIHDNEVATHLYRITQEALNNATRHGRANKILITLLKEAGMISLSISDNGKGLVKPEGEGSGMGLKIMDYRARLIGGNLEVKNQEGGGTLVKCSFPQKSRPGAARETSDII